MSHMLTECDTVFLSIHRPTPSSSPSRSIAKRIVSLSLQAYPRSIPGSGMRESDSMGDSGPPKTLDGISFRNTHPVRSPVGSPFPCSSFTTKTSPLITDGSIPMQTPPSGDRMRSRHSDPFS